MFTITTSTTRIQRTVRFDTLQEAQDWIAACLQAYKGCTIVVTTI